MLAVPPRGSVCLGTGCGGLLCVVHSVLPVVNGDVFSAVWADVVVALPVRAFPVADQRGFCDAALGSDQAICAADSRGALLRVGNR